MKIPYYCSFAHSHPSGQSADLHTVFDVASGSRFVARSSCSVSHREPLVLVLEPAKLPWPETHMISERHTSQTHSGSLQCRRGPTSCRFRIVSIATRIDLLIPVRQSVGRQPQVVALELVRVANPPPLSRLTPKSLLHKSIKLDGTTCATTTTGFKTPPLCQNF